MEKVMQLVRRTATLAASNKKLRPAVDALHAALFEHLPIPVQHLLLEGWMYRGTQGAAARWLKATKSVLLLFEPQIALAYWRETLDYRAAKSLAYQAEPEFLNKILAELTSQCAQGWIVSKAILRAGTMDEEVWSLVGDKHPVTYLYLCAQTGRIVSDVEAWSIVSDPQINDRGLAIWAIGQMGMVTVLDRIAETAPILFEN